MVEFYDFCLLSVEATLVDLAEGEPTPVEVLRTGEFTDSKGRDVVIRDEDLDAYVVAFEAGAAGQEVPIDVDHERKQAAGWITKLWREGEKLLASVNWNELGRQLVGGQVYRYVSATIDLAKRVIRSISLVNFPAVKDLKPVELMNGGDERAKEVTTMPDESNLEELKAQIREEEHQKAQAELAERKAWEAEMRAKIRSEEHEAVLAEVERERGFAEFAEQVCNPEQGAGLAEKPEDVVAFLMSLPAERVDEAKRMLSAKVVEFGEIGSSRDGQEATDNLPSWAAVLLRDWVGSGLDVAEFFEANKAELGEAEQYDLSEFKSE